MARKAVRTITVTLGSVTGLCLASAPAFAGGSSVEGDKIAGFEDVGFTTVPRPTKSYSEMEFSFIDEGDGKATAVEALVGTVVAASIVSKYGDGKTTDTTVSQSLDVAVLSCEPGESIDVDGDRKATFTVKAVRHAPPAASAQSNT